MDMPKSKKLNAGCLKIFDFIKYLYEDRAYYSDVSAIFRDEAEEQTNNSIQVTINKYINALKIFGIKLEKIKGKYELQSGLYYMPFSFGDLKAISILVNAAKNILNKNIQSSMGEFAKELQLRMDYKDKNTLNNLIEMQNNDLSFHYSSTKEQIEQCENICKDGYKINITYMNGNEKTVLKSAYPKEVIYSGKNVFLSVDLTSQNENIQIPITNILSLVAQPVYTTRTELNATVVFKIKNRLVKTYKLKENEYLREVEPDGTLVIVNKDEPFDKLIQRLSRYSYNCEIHSPKRLRDRMVEEINKTLSNYDK